MDEEAKSMDEEAESQPSVTPGTTWANCFVGVKFFRLKDGEWRCLDCNCANEIECLLCVGCDLEKGLWVCRKCKKKHKQDEAKKENGCPSCAVAPPQTPGAGIQQAPLVRTLCQF